MYETLYIDDVDIEQAIDFIDIEDMAQHIYFGPQAEIMETLNSFNQQNQADLSVTKTFRWSPGTYDKVAEMMMRKVGLRRRSSGMYNYLSREDYWWGPGRNRIQTDLRNMDRMISQLRYDGVSWMEDPIVLIERKELFKSYVSEKFERLLDMTNNTDRITVLNVILENDGSRSTRALRLTINLVLSPDEIQIYNVRGATTEPTHIQNLPLEMDLMIKIEMYPLQELIRHTDYDSPSFNVYTLGLAESYDDRGRLNFPYISSNGNRGFNSGDGYGSVCYGDDSTDISYALRRFELPAYGLLLMNWMNRYTQNTNPYNNIKQSYHGEPKWLTESYRAIFGTNSWGDCNYRPSGHADYCDTEECALRHQCEIYRQAHPEPVTPEQAEQLTLQWATRMGGVGANAEPTIIHTTDSEGNPISVTNDLVDTEVVGELTPIRDEAALAADVVATEEERINVATEEERINAEMNAIEAEHDDSWTEEEWEAYQRDARENPEPNNSEEE